MARRRKPGQFSDYSITNNGEPGISLEDEKEILETSRNIAISLDRDEFHNKQPFIISVGYVGWNSGQKGIELDNEIMPLIRAAVEKYVRKRNRAKKAKAAK